MMRAATWAAVDVERVTVPNVPMRKTWRSPHHFNGDSL
jgi:hypothetical protein